MFKSCDVEAADCYEPGIFLGNFPSFFRFFILNNKGRIKHGDSEQVEVVV